MTVFAPLLKLLHHPVTLTQFLCGNWLAAPLYVEISPTNNCPASCPWCFYHGTHTKEELSEDIIYNLILDLKEMGVEGIAWTGGGDPASYTYIDTIVHFANSVGLQQGMFTNGYTRLQNPELLGWIRITITDDFIIPKSVKFYLQHTKVGINFNLTLENSVRVEEIAIKAKEVGVQYFQVRPALMSPQPVLRKPVELKALETDNFKVEFSDYKWEDYLNPHGYPYCHGHRIVPFIWHNGDVATCAYHFGKSDYIFGNLKEKSFPTLWRERKQDSVPVIPECQRCCKLHEVNKGLSALSGDTSLVEDKVFI